MAEEGPTIGRDLRKSIRAKAKYILKYSLRGDNRNMVGVNISQIKDISAGGVKFTCSYKISRGTELDLNVKLPTSGREMFIVGKVEGVEEIMKDMIYETRVKFENINEEQREALDREVKNILGIK